MGGMRWIGRVVVLVSVWLAGAPATAQEYVYASRLILGAGGCLVVTGSGSPDGVIAAPVCSLYLDMAGTGVRVVHKAVYLPP